MTTTGDELYRRMFSRQPDPTSTVEPTYDELLDALRSWMAWINQYGSLLNVNLNDELVNICEVTVDLLSRTVPTDIETQV